MANSDEYEIIKRPNGTWFIHFKKREKFYFTHIQKVVEYMCELSEYLDKEISLGLHDCYSNGMNWKEAAEHVCVNLEEDCGRQVLEKFTEAQEAIDKHLENWHEHHDTRKHMYEAANRKTYGYDSTMSSKEKVEQMILNKFALELFKFKEL